MHRRYILLGLIFAISASYADGSSGCTPPLPVQAKLQRNPRADDYAQAGLWYGDHGKYTCAVEAYQSALKQEPNSADFLYSLGLNLIREGDYRDAVEPLQKSTALKPDVLKPHLLLATAHEELHQPSEARSEWSAALKIDPHSEIALAGASKNLLANNEFESVIILLAPRPKDENLILALAMAYKGIGARDQEIEVLTNGLAENPRSHALTEALIAELVSQQRYQEAENLGKKLVEQSPHDLTAKTLYLHALILNGDEDLARPLAKRLLLASPHNFDVLYLNGLLEDREGNYAAARDSLQKAVALNPNHYNSRYNLALALANLNDLNGARAQLQEALALGAPDPAVRYEYVKVLRKLGETKRAQEELKLYQETQRAQVANTRAAVSVGQGDKELASGDPNKAVAFYRDAVTAVPNSALFNYKLSVALDKVGEIAEERKVLQRALEIDPTMAIAHRQLGYLAFNGGDFSTAEEQFRAAVQAAPAYADAWVSLAATLATESRPSDALQAVQHALEVDPHNANAIELQKELTNAAGQPNP